MSGGKYGKAISTNHRTGTITALSGCKLGTSDFAISGWFKAPAVSSLSTGSTNYLFGICPPDIAGGFSVQIKKASSTSSTVKLRINNVAGGNTQPTISDYTENTWMHLAVVRSGDTLQVYLNGTAMITDGYALTAGYDFGNPKLAFGAYEGWKNNYHNATIWFDDLRVYGQALTADEVTAITNNTDNTTDETTGTVTYSPAPKAHVTFDDNTVVNEGTDTSIAATLYKLDSAKKFVKTTQFIATNGIGTSVVGKYNEGIQTHHRTGANTVLSGYNFGKNDFTISCWFKTPALSSLGSGPNNYIFGIGTPNTANVFSIQLKKDGSTPKLRINNFAGGNSQPKITNYTANTWMHLVAVRSGDTLLVYLDGTLMSTYDFSTTEYAGIDLGSPKLALGSYPGMTGNYQDTSMWFDDLRLYNSALTAEEVGYVYAAAHSSVVSPVALVTYDDGIVANTGTDSTIKAGLYKMSAINASAGANDFIDYHGTTGRDGTIGGATKMRHTEGPYTVLNGYNFGIHDFSVSTWFNVPTDSSNVSGGSGTYLFGICEPDATEGFAVSMKSGNVRLRLNGSTYQPTVTYEKGTWNQVTLTRKDNNVELYFNGTLLNTYALKEDYNFGTKQLAFGGYYGNTNNYHGNTMYFDDMEVTVEGYNTILTSTQNTIKPVVEVNYDGGKIANTGTDSSIAVGTYKLNTSPNATSFVSTSASYTTGMDGDTNGAITMKHNAGAYTVVKNYNFGKNDFAVSTWFNIPLDSSATLSTGGGTYVFGTAPSGANGTTGFSLCLKEGKLRFQVGSSTTETNMSFEKNTWYSLMLRREGTVLEVYLNETLVTTQSLASGHDFGTADLSFGGYINNSGNYHGNSMCYDNIQVYDEGLSAEFVKFMVQAMNHRVAWTTEDNQEISTLFIGDSFFSSRSYWTNFYETYSGKAAYCAGIASATTYDWDAFTDSYLAYTSPKNLVVHLGTNNIHTDGDSADDAIQNLQALFTKIHKLDGYKDTQIYYFGIPYKKSTMYGDGKAFSNEYKTTIDTVNATMETWCNQMGWITYMDDLTGGAVADSQFRDNTHLTLDAYSLITNALVKAGIDMEESGFNFEAETTYRTRTKLAKTANTLSTWIYLPETYDGASRGGAIWGNYEKDAIPFASYEIYTNGNPRFVHVNYESGVKQKTDLKFTNVDVRANDWVNLTFVIGDDAKTVSCYVNGELKQQLTSTYKIVLDAVTVPYTLGGNKTAANEHYFKGRIKELALYEGTLTADQVKNLYTTGLGSTDVAPFTYYQLQKAVEAQNVSDVKAANNLVGRGRYFTEKDPVTDYVYSFAVVGDPQIISINDYKYGNDNLAGMYDWIVANKDAKNIQHVFNMGDITDGNLPVEWEAAATQNKKLSDAGIQYTVVRGNHDLVSYNKQGDTDYYSQYMGTDEYRAQFADGGFYDEADISNSWRTFTVGEVDYLLLTLDFGVVSHYGVKLPTDEHKAQADAILAWAGNVITAHPDHKVILTTHGYMTADGTTLDVNDGSNPSENYGTYDGDQLWDNFVSKYENMFLVMSGHISTENVFYRQDTGVHGNTVTSMLINFQGTDRYNELAGVVTMLYFSKDGKTIEVENYSTVQKAYFLDKYQLTVEVEKPKVEIDFMGGVVANSGTNTSLTVGAYKLNATNDGFEESTDATFVSGVDGDSNGALRLRHNLAFESTSTDTSNGAYAVVKNYNFGTSDFTISANFKVPTKVSDVEANGGQTYLFGIDNPNTTSGFAVSLKQSAIRLKWGDGTTGYVKNPSVTWNAGEWNQIVLCRKGGYLYLYLNGTLLNSGQPFEIGETCDFGTKDLAFGGYYGWTSTYKSNWMDYDNIQIYNRALTMAQ